MSARVPSIRAQGTAIVAAGFGQNLILTMVTTFILVYLVQYAKLDTAAVGAVTAILTVARVIDAVSDPLMGSIIDKTRTRWGKLRPFILLSAAPVALQEHRIDICSMWRKFTHRVRIRSVSS